MTFPDAEKAEPLTIISVPTLPELTLVSVEGVIVMLNETELTPSEAITVKSPGGLGGIVILVENAPLLSATVEVN